MLKHRIKEFRGVAALLVLLAVTTACHATPSENKPVNNTASVIDVPVKESCDFMMGWVDDRYLYLSSTGPSGVLVDLSVSPPRFYNVRCYGRSPGGKFVMSGDDRATLLITSDPSDNSKAVKLPLAVPAGKYFPHAAAGFLGERAVLFPLIDAGFNSVKHPVIQTDSSVREMTELPPANEDPCHGICTLGNGHTIIMWNGDAYEFAANSQDTKPIAVWKLNCKPSYWNDAIMVPVGEDGFMYVSGRKLFEVHSSNKQPIAHEGAALSNILEIHPGPRGSILMRCADQEVGVLYYPATRQANVLRADMFSNMQYNVDGLIWSPACNKIVAVSGRSLFFADVP